MFRFALVFRRTGLSEYRFNNQPIRAPNPAEIFYRRHSFRVHILNTFLFIKARSKKKIPLTTSAEEEHVIKWRQKSIVFTSCLRMWKVSSASFFIAHEEHSSECHRSTETLEILEKLLRYICCQECLFALEIKRFSFSLFRVKKN